MAIALTIGAVVRIEIDIWSQLMRSKSRIAQD